MFQATFSAGDREQKKHQHVASQKICEAIIRYRFVLHAGRERQQNLHVAFRFPPKEGLRSYKQTSLGWNSNFYCSQFLFAHRPPFLPKRRFSKLQADITLLEQQFFTVRNFYLHIALSFCLKGGFRRYKQTALCWNSNLY